MRRDAPLSVLKEAVALVSRDWVPLEEFKQAQA
jgi:hypothetical protein